MGLPNTETLFGGNPEAPRLTPAEVSSRFDAFLEKVDGVATTTIDQNELAKLGQGQPLFENGRATSVRPANAMEALTKALGAPELTKALGADGIASITAALEATKAQTPDLVKDLNLTSPLSTGLVAYDLEAPAKMLTPRPTPLRNRIARRRGIGTAHKFKVISGFTGTVTGGQALVRPGITETTQNDFKPSGASNSLYYARGPKISYAGYDVSVPYKQFSLSDEVTWAAQYAGQGFQDIRQLSKTSLLYASMLAEERLLLGGRGASGDGFAGAVSAPSISVAARSKAGSEVGLSGVTTNVYVKVVATTVWGTSVLSTVANVAATNGTQVVDVTITDVTGALGYDIYVGTGASDPGDAARFYAGHTGYNVFTLDGALPTSGKAASSITADTTSSSLDYDGILSICTNGAGGQASGYSKRLNAAFSTSQPGSEFQAAFAAMYDPASGGVLADPDRVLMNGLDRKQLSETLKGSSSSNYTMRIAQDEVSGVMLGAIINSIVNEVTGKHVEVEVHPYLPQGNAPIISDTLPIPDSQVSDCFAAFNVQDLMGVDWTPQQFAFESSSYWFGTFVCYAPQWQGIVQGIKKA